jgi:hypothetical protein
VKECNNILEESRDYNDQDPNTPESKEPLDSMFKNARKRLNLEAALLEQSSVVSD